MKLLSLNTWGGRAYEPLIEYIAQKSKGVDVFCFQEVFSNYEGRLSIHEYRANLLQELEKILPEFQWFFCSNIDRMDMNGEVDFNLQFGLATFYKKTCQILSKGEVSIVKLPRPKDLNKQDTPQNLLFIEINKDGKTYLLVNTHTLAYPGSKRDTPARLEQSQKIIEFLNTKKGAKILCGDFNLEPDTKSIRLIEDSGMRNLIKEYNIKDTRGPINHKLYEGISKQRFADYVFVDGDIKALDFQCPYVAISDHLPMILEFE